MGGEAGAGDGTAWVLHPFYGEASARSAFFTAANVWAISLSPWASETKAASNCEGGRYTPSSSSVWKKRPNRAESAFRALAASNTGSAVKKAVHMLPTRLRV